MKKSTLSIALSLCFLGTSALANECVDKIDAHVFNQGTLLILDNCKINDNDMPAIVDYLQKHTTITAIDLSDNNISSNSIGLLKPVYNLHNLYIANNKLGAYGAYEIAQMSLETLSIDDNNIGNEGAKALARNSSITQLSVSNNSLTGEGISALATHPSVWNLNIANSSFDKASLTALSKNKIMRWLNVSNSNLSADDAITLAAHTKTIEEVDFSNNPIGNKGIIGFLQKVTPRALYAMGCSIGDEGAIVIAKHNYDYLFLDKNHINDAGAAALAKTKTPFIDLEDNDISNDGAATFANAKIDNLDLSHNYYLDNRTAFALAKNSSLKWLRVRFNTIDKDGEEALHNSGIEYVDTAGNVPEEVMSRSSHTSKSSNHLQHGKDKIFISRHNK